MKPPNGQMPDVSQDKAGNVGRDVVDLRNLLTLFGFLSRRSQGLARKHVAVFGVAFYTSTASRTCNDGVCSTCFCDV